MIKKLLRWLGYAAAALAIAAIAFAAFVWIQSSRIVGHRYGAVQERLVPSSIAPAEGDRLAHVLGCYGCHGAGLRGGLVFEDRAFATVWAPNLTLVAARATDQQLAAAIRQGIGVDGRGLWIMPSAMYARLTDAELAAVIAAVRAQPRGGAVATPVRFGPIGRMVVATGGLEPAPARLESFRVHEPFDPGPAFAAGRHLAAITCADCHGADLSGGQPTPDEAAPALVVAGAYSLEQFRVLLRTGRTADGRQLGLMAEAARNDLSHLSDAEIASLHAYLRARAERVTQ